MIEGFLDYVACDEVYGWAFDRTQPSLPLAIDIHCGARHLGSTTADAFRPDLATAGIGEGAHGFAFRFPQLLEPHELAAVTVRARGDGGPESARELPRFLRKTTTPRAMDSYEDVTQFPVFVLGAPRSGTSAVVQALIHSTPFAGRPEGHILDLLAPLLHEVRDFYRSKSDELTHPERALLIHQLPYEYFEIGIKRLFAEAVRPLFPGRHWCDKTPTPNMILAAPDLLRLWPNARFIFLKRRALENLRSRVVKFPTLSFAEQCRDWTTCMDAWRRVRAGLSGRALELDQLFLARNPERSAQALGTLLSLEPESLAKLERVLRNFRPERTSAEVGEVCDEQTLAWDADQWSTFERTCGPMMAAYGYSRNRNYFARDRELEACIAL